MSVSNCETFYEDVPTLGEVKREISSIVGLREIKKQLESILQKIIDAEKNAADGFRVVPPKPFHMVFVGRNGTGKSTVARIIGKLFYLAGVLSSYTVTEMRGHQKMRDANGGLLLVKIDEEDPISSDTMEELIAAIDKGKSLIVLAGNHRALNQYMKCNLNLYRRLSTRLQFDDLTCEDLAMILEKKASIKGESDMLCGFELDSSCSTDSIARMIAELTPHNLRSLLNAHLLDQMLIEAKKVARPGENTISLKNLEMGIQNGAEIFKHLLNL
ncbi:stage V sporulation protein K-like [Salvia hispanica]|uniref:stage V sporulation protein K-like n=1 Tax=Salvia hispanica TaxID=49212 RepID=UPI002009914A|nr:stage V sporulation protein K-like [Salvia hispanica]